MRTRGVVAGLALLCVSPVVALAGNHGAVPVAARVTTVTASPAVAVVAASDSAERAEFRAREAEIRSRLTPATPPPTQPPPTATPTPAPVVRATRPTAAAAPPIPAAPPPAPGTIEAIIQSAATKWGVSYAWMLKIARCESGLNPRAINPTGPFIGLFQFYPSTFKAHGGTDIYDPVQQADITGFMLSHGGANAWSCA